MKIVPLALLITLSAAKLSAQPLVDEDYRPIDISEAKLGQKLFYDPILSGNKNISCATCHHPNFATGDGLSLGLGEGGIGLGPKRRANPKNMPEQRIPRHAQALFNLGAKEFTVLFHDGRIEEDDARPSGLRTPLDDEMLTGLVSLLSAQTMFPVLSQDEMAGHYSENDVSKAVRSGRITGAGGAWNILSTRIRSIEEYSKDFKPLYDHINVPADIQFTDISNAIAAFIEFEWRSDQSPFDAYQRGEATLSKTAISGLELFNENCSNCHSGPFQTDHKFHAMGVPQFGPGKAARFENHARDTGRMRVTGNLEDKYAFRTPSLRNVTHTAPYGHTGAYNDLKDFIESHVSTSAINDYSINEAVLPKLPVNDLWILSRPEELADIIDHREVPRVSLTNSEIDQIVAFLDSLSDPIALNGRLGIPETVPSGLNIDR
jgi:cytochrome c peroxidase